MDWFFTILKEIALVTVAMAPYLLFGFFVAGILSVLISKSYVRRHLGGKGWKATIKAALFGVPMPICSCGVIPLAASLRKHGASRGATASFLASTPQTGVDSLMITYALLGWVFAVVRAVVAFVSGVVCGVAVEAVSKNEVSQEVLEDEVTEVSTLPAWRRSLEYGFISLPRSISKAVLIGIIFSGILSGLVPPDFFADRLGDSPVAMLAMLLIGIPLYVCSSASVPIALAFIKAGISPGAALVFLIVGPATNTATLTTLWQIIGKKQLVVFLSVISVLALVSGAFMNLLHPVIPLVEEVKKMDMQASPLDIFWTVLLLVVLLKAILPVRKKAGCEIGR